MLGSNLAPAEEEVGVPGARAVSAVALLAVLLAGLLAGCGGSGDEDPAPLAAAPPPAPATAPQPAAAPVGEVWPLEPAGSVAVDAATRTLAVAVDNPPRVLLGALDQGTPQREVPLPGAAGTLSFAGDGGPLLVPVPQSGALLRVPLVGGATARTDVAGTPQAATVVEGWTVVAAGDRVVVIGADGATSSVPGFADAAGLTPVGAKVSVLDVGRSAVVLLDPATGDLGPAMRAGDGAVAAVTDRFDRTLHPDVRDGELLVVAGDPPLLRQRWPLAGGPYAIAYDSARDLAWVTLTERNEVVGLNVAGGEPVLVHRFPTVRQPDAVAVDPRSGRVVVASAVGAGLQVIDPKRVVQ